MKKIMVVISCIISFYSLAGTGDDNKLPHWVKDFTKEKIYNLINELQAISRPESKEFLDRFSNILKRTSCCLSKYHYKPLSSHLLTGKNETFITNEFSNFANVLERKLLVIDIAELQSDKAESLGKYKKEFETLSPYSLILFKNLERANEKILEEIYDILDEGVLLYSNDNHTSKESIMFNNFYLFFTTNITNDVVNTHSPENPISRKYIFKLLNEKFKTGLLNRFDSLDLFSKYPTY